MLPGYDLSFYAEAVNNRLSKLFPSRGPELYSLAKRAVLGGGKRVRATLALLSCEAVFGDYRPALPLAVAYELAHSAALIQDDIIDQSRIRRRMKSLWAEHGIAKAVLSMDVVLFSIPSILGEYARNGLSGARFDMLLKMIGNSLRDASLGEFLDLQLAEREDVGLKDYLEMVKLKTGSLLAAPAACGAIVGLGSQREIEALRNFGEALGAAYQITDDVLDITGSTEKIGKPQFNDLRNGKKNIVVILSLKALKQSRQRTQQQFIRSLLGTSLSDREVVLARRIFNQTLSIKRAEALAAELMERGKEEIAKLKETEGKKKLLQLSNLLVRRSE